MKHKTIIALSWNSLVVVSAMLLLLMSTMLMSLETNTGTVETVKESPIKKPQLSRFQQRLKEKR
jgi:hypothetical protein